MNNKEIVILMLASPIIIFIMVFPIYIFTLNWRVSIILAGIFSLAVSLKFIFNQPPTK